MLLFTNAYSFLSYSLLYDCLFKVKEKPNLCLRIFSMICDFLLNSPFPPALQILREITAIALCSPEGGGHSFIFLPIHRRPFENLKRLLATSSLSSVFLK